VARREGSLVSTSELTVLHWGGSVTKEGEFVMMADGHGRRGSIMVARSVQSDRGNTVPSLAEKGLGGGALGEWGVVVAGSLPEGRFAAIRRCGWLTLSASCLSVDNTSKGLSLTETDSG